ncbi:MAG: 2-amino-4-hydroxy-6-hydroxymethyldihydropteridine diphosphokinase [Gammaproteobacteria bacterium]
MPRVYVSIGSNIEREANIRAAVQGLRERYGGLVLSSVYESEAVGFKGEDFYNLVAAFDSEEAVSEIGDFLRGLEQRRGRRRGGARFASRTLDMDLLLYGDQVLEEGRIRLPRDEITACAFVLCPLAEIAGSERHPVSGLCYEALWREFDKRGQRLAPVSLVL